MLIRELLDSRNILLGELNLLEVLCNSGRSDRFGNDGVTTNLAPGQDNLSWRSALLLGDSLNFRTCDEKRNVEEVVAKGRVGSDVNVLLLGVSNELLAGEDRVSLDLVDGGNEISLLNEGLQCLICEVGHTNGADLALRQLVDGLPCLAVRDRVVDVDFVRICGGREEIGVRILAWAEVDGPMDEVKVEVVELKLGESVIEGGLDVGGIVLGIPQL